MHISLLLCLYAIFVSNITLTILTLALPYIARDLNASPSATNWVTLGPMLVVALLTPAAGRASDVWGRKRTWIGGFAVSLVGMAASALAPSLGPLLVARLVTAAGTALLIPAALAISTDLFPPEERATPIGYWTSAVAVSPLAGVLIGGSLLDLISWRWLFAAQVALGLPALLLAAWRFEEQTFEIEGRFDLLGSFVVGVVALTTTLAASWLGSPSMRFPWALIAGATALAFTFLSVVVERRAENPVLPPALIADPVVRLSLISRALLTFSYMGAFMTLPYLFKELWHLSALSSSLLLIWRPLAMGLTGPLAGKLAPRMGSARLVVWGGYFILIASLSFLWLDDVPQHALVVLGLALAGTGLGLCGPGSVTVVVERIGSAMLGTVSALMTLTSSLANALGMAAMFALVEGLGGIQDPSAYRASFALGALMSAVGVWTAHALVRGTHAPSGADDQEEPALRRNGTLDIR